MGDTAVVDPNTDAQADAEDAALEAAFTEGFEKPATVTDQPTATPPADEDGLAAEATEPEKPAPKYRQITEEEFAQLTERLNLVDSVGKRADTALGKIGGLERTFRELQASTPAGQAVELSDEDMAELKENFPELAGMMKSTLTKALSKIRGTGAPAPSVDLDSLRTEFEAKLIEERTKTLNRVMDSLDRTWRKDVNSQEWKDWISKKSEEDQKAINESEEPSFVLDKLKEFRTDLEAAKKAQPSPKTPETREDPAEARRRRLRAGAQPRSAGDSGPSGDDEEAAFQAGYKANAQ
jgi:hypothetical protein